MMRLRENDLYSVRLKKMPIISVSKFRFHWYDVMVFCVSSNQLFDVTESQPSLPSPQGGLMLRLRRSLLKSFLSNP